MKITVGSGSVIEEPEGVIKLDSTVISLYTKSKILSFAYCLRPGEQVRKVSNFEYEVIF